MKATDRAVLEVSRQWVTPEHSAILDVFNGSKPAAVRACKSLVKRGLLESTESHEDYGQVLEKPGETPKEMSARKAEIRPQYRITARGDEAIAEEFAD